MKGVAQDKVSKGSFATCPTCADEWAARGCKVCQGCGYPYGRGGRHTCKAMQPSLVKVMIRKPPRTPATLTPLPNGNMPDPAWVPYPHPQTTARPAPLHA